MLAYFLLKHDIAAFSNMNKMHYLYNFERKQKLLLHLYHMPPQLQLHWNYLL